MTKSIIFITEFGFSKRDTARYGLNVLRKRGLKTRVLDIAKLTRDNPKNTADKLKTILLNEIKDFSDINIAGPGFLNFKLNSGAEPLATG